MPGRELPAHRTPAGEDRFGEHHPLGTSTIDVKLSSKDAGVALLIIEHVRRAAGGPARPLHHGPEEWFHALEGEFAVDVGDQRFHLSPGGSVLAPRKVPHVWPT
jgi:mannose-6-phosphate isomerase-like protein (cupin superfamily)